MRAFPARYAEALARYTHPDDQRALRENQSRFYTAFRRLVNRRLQDDTSIDEHTRQILGEPYTVQIDGHRVTVSLSGIAAVVEPLDKVAALEWYAQLCRRPFLCWHVVNDCLYHGLDALRIPVQDYISAYERQKSIQQKVILMLAA